MYDAFISEQPQFQLLRSKCIQNYQCSFCVVFEVIHWNFSSQTHFFFVVSFLTLTFINHSDGTVIIILFCYHRCEIVLVLIKLGKPTVFVSIHFKFQNILIIISENFTVLLKKKSINYMDLADFRNNQLIRKCV